MLTSIVAFTAAAFVISMVPGPSTVVIVRMSVMSGRRTGVAAVLGNETGVLLWGLAAAFGLSALLLASQVVYDVMRGVGAVVLVWVGVRSLWQARRGAGEAPEAVVAVPAVRTGRAYRLGLVTNAANPKAGVFALSFLPQFVPPGASVPAVLVLFSVVWVVVDLLWYLALVWLAGRVRRVLTRPSVRRRMEQVSGLVLVGLGVRLAADAR